ncbi:hypothetical protein ABEF95_002820 [Exophiala dermatitidis]
MSSPRLGAQKGVTIYDEPENIGSGRRPDGDASVSPTLVASHPHRFHRASISGKKMTGRPPLPHSSSTTSLVNQGMSYLSLDNAGSNSNNVNTNPDDSKTPDLRVLLSQVVDWLQEEKAKRQRRRQRRHHLHSLVDHHRPHAKVPGDQPDESSSRGGYESPVDNEADLSLEKLENILSGFTSPLSSHLSRPTHKSSTSHLRRGSIARKYKRSTTAPQSSDTEFFGDDILVPSVEAYLDNSKTMAFTGGLADADTSESAKGRDYQHWVNFKRDIVRLTHTLKLKGWRRIPIDRAQDIEVVRLSGALTNAVYVVRPPKNMEEYDRLQGDGTTPGGSSTSGLPVSKRQPIQLLLRIYGPQVEHLIDRQAELNILRRLARRRIGPRLLGSFDNGRFEEYLHAKTLTAEDLRVPETSKQIAKRMRELHDGIELLESEIEAGPAIFINWDKWVDRCEKIITWLDQQVYLAEQEARAQQAEAEAEAGAGEGVVARKKPIVNPRYVRRGLICGVPWPVFRKTYEAYRKRLIADCGGMDGIRKALVFAHNDTQYGNLMRLEPSGESPLLQPSNQHKQLVVIDFEYASQNTRGLEFANHFTEWCYNYHRAEHNYACDTRRYPNESEQYRFVRSYVMHRPQFNPAASSTPKLEGREKTNISDFMLDARTPATPGTTVGGINETDYEKEETEREKAQEEEIQRLLRETRVWRLANSAQWVAWGIVQAKIPELEALERKEKEKQKREEEAAAAAAAKKASAGGGAARVMMDKVKEMTKTRVDAAVGGMRDRYQHLHQHHLHLDPMSDAPNEEEKRIQMESRWDRPEGRLQEEAHHEGDDGGVVATPESGHVVNNGETGEEQATTKATKVTGVADVDGTDNDRHNVNDSGSVTANANANANANDNEQAKANAIENVSGGDQVESEIDATVDPDKTPSVHSRLDPADDREGENDHDHDQSASGGDDEQDDDEGFDYLGYAHERAMFFWGDCVQMGLVKEEELPESMRARIKMVPY